MSFIDEVNAGHSVSVEVVIPLDSGHKKIETVDIINITPIRFKKSFFEDGELNIESESVTITTSKKPYLKDLMNFVRVPTKENAFLGNGGVELMYETGKIPDGAIVFLKSNHKHGMWFETTILEEDNDGFDTVELNQVESSGYGQVMKGAVIEYNNPKNYISQLRFVCNGEYRIMSSGKLSLVSENEDSLTFELSDDLEGLKSQMLDPNYYTFHYSDGWNESDKDLYVVSKLQSANFYGVSELDKYTVKRDKGSDASGAYDNIILTSESGIEVVKTRSSAIYSHIVEYSDDSLYANDVTDKESYAGFKLIRTELIDEGLSCDIEAVHKKDNIRIWDYIIELCDFYDIPYRYSPNLKVDKVTTNILQKKNISVIEFVVTLAYQLDLNVHLAGDGAIEFTRSLPNQYDVVTGFDNQIWINGTQSNYGDAIDYIHVKYNFNPDTEKFRNQTFYPCRIEGGTFHEIQLPHIQSDVLANQQAYNYYKKKDSSIPYNKELSAKRSFLSALNSELFQNEIVNSTDFNLDAQELEKKEVTYDIVNDDSTVVFENFSLFNGGLKGLPLYWQPDSAYDDSMKYDSNKVWS